MAQTQGGVAEATRRQLRQEIRDQNAHLQRNKEVLCDLSSNRMQDFLRRADVNLEKQGIQMTAKDVASHAELFRNITGCGKDAASKLVQKHKGHTPLDLITALRAIFVHTSNPQRDGEEDPSALNWDELYASGRHLFRPAPGVTCMMGPLEAKPKERKAPVQRAKKQALGAVERPDELADIADADKQMPEHVMETMWEIIKAQTDPMIRVAELVCNPTSFGQTVYNLFILSFLVRDNRVAMLVDADLGLCVRSLEAKKADISNAGAGKEQGAKQFIVPLDMTHWENMCSLVAPSACLMPHRDESQFLGGQGEGEGSAQRGQMGSMQGGEGAQKKRGQEAGGAAAKRRRQ